MHGQGLVARGGNDWSFSCRDLRVRRSKQMDLVAHKSLQLMVGWAH